MVAHCGVSWLSWSPDGTKLAAGCKDGTVHVWETASGRKLHVLRGHKSPVCSVSFSSDGTRVAAWGQDGTVKIWDANTGRLTAEVAHPGGVTAGGWSPDDKLLASGHGDGTVTVSGTHAGDKIVTLRGHIRRINRVEWSPDGTRLASASRDSTARIWNVALGKMVLGPLRHSHEITSLAWEPDGQRLATGSVDETVKIWNTTTAREVATLRGHFQTVTSLSWGSGGCLASGCRDGSVKIWNSIRDQESSVLPGNDVGVRSVYWSPDGKRLASGSYDGTVRIWDPVTREQVLTLQRRVNQDEAFGNVLEFQCRLAWSPDGKHLASAGLHGTAKVWEVATGREVFAFPADHGMVCSVGWNRNGTHLAVGAADGTIRVVEGLKQTPKVHLFKAHPGGWVRCLAWSPQGNRLASGGWGDALVKVWDPLRGVELARMRGHQYPLVLGVAWSPDGKRLASAGADHLVITWDAQTGRKLSTMRGHNDFVDGVVWSPDGTRLASAGYDNSVRVWDPWTGEEAFTLRGNAGMFHYVSWSPDGAQLAAASSDGQIWLWDATRGFERDTTPRALPYIDRKVASGTARGEDILWYAESYLRSARHFDEQGNAPLAKATRTKARALFEEKMKKEPENLAWAAGLAQLLVDAGRTREAIPYLAKASSANPQDTVLSIKVAALQAWFGQEKELAATRQRSLAFAKGTNDEGTAERACKACCIRPSTNKAELEAALALGRTGAKINNKGQWTLLSLGMAEYRSGNYTAADQALLAAAKASKNMAWVTGISAFYRAMSLFRQGKPDEACKLALAAAAKMKPLPKDERNPLANNAHYDDLILWLS
ncbi:MAG: tetratricopeptide repeat protein [Gemmataceae bacterium]